MDQDQVASRYYLGKQCICLAQKRFYTRGTFWGMRISRMDKIPTLYRDWLRSLK